MKFRVLAAVIVLTLTCVGQGADPEQQDIDAVLTGVDGTALMRQLQERQQKINQLSDEEKTALNAAREKAMTDPAVKAALASRNEAAQELAVTLQANMLKTDPELASFFEKMTTAPGQR